MWPSGARSLFEGPTCDAVRISHKGRAFLETKKRSGQGNKLPKEVYVDWLPGESPVEAINQHAAFERLFLPPAFFLWSRENTALFFAKGSRISSL